MCSRRRCTESMSEPGVMGMPSDVRMGGGEEGEVVRKRVLKGWA